MATRRCYNPTAVHPFLQTHLLRRSQTDTEGLVGVATQPVVIGSGGGLSLATDDELR
jgi:hypothetical protein